MNQSKSGDTLKIAFAVIAILVAVGAMVWFYKSQQPHEVGHAELPAGSNPKVQAMKAMKAGNPAAGAQDPNDLGAKP